MRTRALYHYFSVQNNNLSSRDASGAINRSWAFEKRNIKCQIQEIGKAEAVERYGIQVAEVMYLILYQDPTLTIDETKRFIIHNDPRNQIYYAPKESDIKILEYKGKREAVIHQRRRHAEFRIFAEWNKRWIL